MMPQRLWLWIGGVILGAAAALAFGVSLGTLVVVAAIFACPVAMYCGMRGMDTRQESARVPQHEQAAVPELGRPPKDGTWQRSTPREEDKPHT
jgi:uncharacterized membrane protein YdjX (TVP38/TMEM64 family)